jgi:hypothetical protein
MSRSLHPEHQTDLENSGLTPSTITAAGIYTVPPDIINRKLGGLASGVVSALAFPYPGCDGYERFKVWREEGREGPKYLQKPGTPNHLYVPTVTDLSGDETLLITEGEKKSLALSQAGFQTVGIGGVWNWRGKGEDNRSGESRPINDLDRVNWGRSVTIVFDSDGHDNSNIRLTAFRLARELSGRGATVSILFLPPGEAGEKVGVDDYLVADSPEVLRELLGTAWPFDPSLDDDRAEIAWQTRDLTLEAPNSEKLEVLAGLIPTMACMSHTRVDAVLEKLRESLGLRQRDLDTLRRDIKRERSHRESRREGQGSLIQVGDLEADHRLHPAIDFLGDAMTIGFRVNLPNGEEGLMVLLSDGQGVRSDVDPEQIEIGGEPFRVSRGGFSPFLEEVWGLDRVKSFLENPTIPKNLFQEIRETLGLYLDLPEKAYGLLTAWAIATYFAHQFAAFPFLHFHGPKECGKSKTLEALRFLCLSAWKGRDITAAALGDTMEGQRGTMLIDQAEKLGQNNDGHLVGLLADSYKKAGGRRRVVNMDRGSRRVLEFSTYGPKAFASTKGLDPDLADRCVRIPMTRTRKKLPDLEGWEPEWADLRDACYRFTLLAFKEVEAAYKAIPGDGTRMRELWRPLGAVLKALKVEESEAEAILEFFMSQVQETRHEPTGWEITLLEALKSRAEKEDGDFEMTPEDILKAMNLKEEDKGPSNKWVGDILSQYNLYHHKGRPKKQGQKITLYQFKPARVIELCQIYLRDTSQNDMSLMSPEEKTRDISKLDGARENEGTCPLLSPSGVLDRGHEGSCPPESTCPSYRSENIGKNEGGHGGHEKSGGMAEKQFSSFTPEHLEALLKEGEEIEL